MLPSHPLLRNLVLITLVRKTQLVLRVVMFGDVIQYRQPLEDGEVVPVMVDDGRDAPVRVDGSEPGLFLGVFHDVYGLVGDFRDRRGGVAIEVLELFEKHGDFVSVWRAEGEDLDAGGGDETCWFGGHFFFFFGGGGAVGAIIQ